MIIDTYLLFYHYRINLIKKLFFDRLSNYFDKNIIPLFFVKLSCHV